MKFRTISAAIFAASMGLMVTACGNKTNAEAAASTAASMTETTTAEDDAKTTEAEITVGETATKTTEAEITVEETTGSKETEAVGQEVFQISNGGWFLHGEEDEVSIDMDGLKGFTSYTKEAIPETDGYLVYKGETEDGWPVFDVMDIYGQYFSTITFTSEEQFYLGEDPEQYYVKWDY